MIEKVDILGIISFNDSEKLLYNRKWGMILKVSSTKFDYIRNQMHFT